MSEPLKDSALNLDSDTSGVILDTAKAIYADEQDRFKQADTKTGVGLAFIGVFFNVALTYYGRVELEGMSSILLVLLYLLRLSVLIFYALGAYKLIRVFKIEQFEQISINDILKEDLILYKPAEAKITIAATYQKLINSNEVKINKKLERFDRALRYPIIAFSLFIICLVAEGVILYGK